MGEQGNGYSDSAYNSLCELSFEAAGSCAGRFVEEPYTVRGSGDIYFDGDLKLQSTAAGDVTLFEDTDVADAAPGKYLRIYRKASEGDGSIDFHVAQNGTPYMDMNSLSGINKEALEQETFEVFMEQAIKKLPEVGTVVSRIGRPEIATDPMGPDMVDTYVFLKPKSETPK